MVRRIVRGINLDRAISLITVLAMLGGWASIIFSHYYQGESDHAMNVEHSAIITRLDKSDATRSIIIDQLAAIAKDHEERIRQLEWKRHIEALLNGQKKEDGLASPEDLGPPPKTFTTEPKNTQPR